MKATRRNVLTGAAGLLAAFGLRADEPSVHQRPPRRKTDKWDELPELECTRGRHRHSERSAFLLSFNDGEVAICPTCIEEWLDRQGFLLGPPDREG